VLKAQVIRNDTYYKQHKIHTAKLPLHPEYLKRYFTFSQNKNIIKIAVWMCVWLSANLTERY